MRHVVLPARRLVSAADPQAQGTLIQNWARRLGLGTQPPIDLTGATSGYLPTPGVASRRRSGFPWTEGQAVNLADRPGRSRRSARSSSRSRTPRSINGGKVVRPHVGEAVIRNGVRHLLRFKPVRKVKLSPYTWAIRQGLYEAANNAAGTSAAVFGGFQPTVAGKTGTAETGPELPRPLVVRVVGAVQPPEARRRRDDRERRLRRRGGGAGSEEDLRGVLPPQELVVGGAFTRSG